MRKLFLLAFLCLVSLFSTAQNGKISGTVISSKTGEKLNRVTVLLLETKVTKISDQNGNFNFNNLPPKKYSLQLSIVGYATKIVEDIEVVANDVVNVNVSLDEKPTKGDAGDVIVMGNRVKASKENTSALLVAQKNMANMSDGISGQALQGTPVKTTSDAIKKVSGATIQDDKFAIIRGLNDRYNFAQINGAPLPSTESDRKAFSFDIFPANILDNLVIYKTATPDLPSEFAGGILNLTTKSIPTKNFTSISVGSGYNSLTSFKDFVVSEQKGKYDFIGIDDGKRGIPDGLPSSDSLKAMNYTRRGEYSKLFSNYKWGVMTKQAAPNLNFQFAKGLNIERKEKDFLGLLFSASYNRNFSANSGQRNSYLYDVSVPGGQIDDVAKYTDRTFNDEVLLGLLSNVSVKLDNNNSINLKNTYSINTDNKIIERNGAPDFLNDPTIKLRDKVRWYTGNRIFTSQLTGEHLISKYKTKLNWVASTGRVVRAIPQLNRTSYLGVEPDYFSQSNSNSINQSNGNGIMFSTKSNESINSFKIDVQQPYSFLKSTQNFFKVGINNQKRERDFAARLLGFSQYNQSGVNFDFSLESLDESKIFAAQNLGRLSNNKGGWVITDGTQPNFAYNAESGLNAGYIMNDQRILKKFRLITGVRFEQFTQSMKTARSNVDKIDLKTSVKDWLPSANLVYALTPKINLRVSYSQTINRPEFRELAPYLFYDFVTQFTFEGSEKLNRAKITNYDFRFEYYPGNAQVISVSAFSKDFINPIEILSDPVFDNLAGYTNAKTAKVYGAEAEVRLVIGNIFGIKGTNALLNKFSISGNASLNFSEVQVAPLGLYDPSRFVTDRALQGQSPYVLNANLAFSDTKRGWNVNASFNKVGDRVSIAGTLNRADIYELARSVIDFQVSKFFLKNKLEVKLNARDLLSPNLTYYLDMDMSRSYTDADRIFSQMNMPKVFSVSFSYKF